MAIVMRNVRNYYSPIEYNGTILPYGITVPLLHFTDHDPISPPVSPREEGEIECLDMLEDTGPSVLSIRLRINLNKR